MEINANLIETELQELAGDRPVKVKLNKHLRSSPTPTSPAKPIACSTIETDKGITITLNPSRFRNPKKLDECLNNLRSDVAWAN